MFQVYYIHIYFSSFLYVVCICLFDRVIERYFCFCNTSFSESQSFLIFVICLCELSMGKKTIENQGKEQEHCEFCIICNEMTVTF